MLVAEGVDRLSRGQEHLAALFKQMGFLGIQIVTVADGLVSELHVGLKGTMSTLFLKDLAQKTHRGLEGRVRKGMSGGGCGSAWNVDPLSGGSASKIDPLPRASWRLPVLGRGRAGGG